MENIHEKVMEQVEAAKDVVRSPRQYYVAESDGVAIKEYPCTNRFNYNGGSVFHYKGDHNQVELVLVPRKYRYGQSQTKLLIGKNKGNTSAAILLDVGDLMVGRSTDPDAPGEDLSLLARTHMAAMGYKTLYERNVPWKWLIIGIAALVVVVGIVWFIRSQAA